MRIARLLFLSLCTATITACNESNTPVSASRPPVAGWPVVYSAVGGSDAVGFGSTRPCSLFDDCDGNGYAWVAARRLRADGFPVTVVPIGIPGAVVGPALQQLAALSGRTDVVDNLADSAVARLRQTTTLVTLAAGAQDLNIILSALDRGLGSTDPAAFVDQQSAVYAREFATLRNAVRENAPGARMIVINLPNAAALPYLAAASPVRKQLAQRAAVKMSAAMNDTGEHVRVIDVMCDSRFYAASAYSSDGLHFSDAAYAMLGAAVADALTAPSYVEPRSTCPQMTLY